MLQSFLIVCLSNKEGAPWQRISTEVKSWWVNSSSAKNGLNFPLNPVQVQGSEAHSRNFNVTFFLFYNVITLTCALKYQKNKFLHKIWIAIFLEMSLLLPLRVLKQESFAHFWRYNNGSSWARPTKYPPPSQTMILFIWIANTRKSMSKASSFTLVINSTILALSRA